MTFEQDYIRKVDAAQARADIIAAAFTRCNGIELPNKGKNGARYDLFFHCIDHPELPDTAFAEWLVQAYAAPAAKRQQLWKRVQQARRK